MPSSNKIISKEQAKKQVLSWKTAGDKIVFTNGCFDILHVGHVDYLEKAQALGNKLVLGLNTDNSISRLKGPSRPIVPQGPRSRVMAALEFIDLVVLFDEDTPLSLISYLEPDILVKGNDYTIENIVGAKEVLALGGKVETIPLVEGFSTSTIIQKIKEDNP